MAKLFMITGLGSASDLALGKKGAFYSTLEEFHKYWERIDIICPKVRGSTSLRVLEVEPRGTLFGNVFLHVSPWPLIFHPIWFLWKSISLYRRQKFDLMTVNDFAPFYNGIAARILWRVIKVPYILEILHIPGYPRAANFKEKLYKVFTKFFIKWDASKAWAVRIINQKETPRFLISAGVKKEKLKYIPAFYIDLNVFRPVEVEKEYDLVFAARLEKNKGIYELLQAISKVKIQMPNIRLLIIGAGPELENLKLETKNYKLETNVYFSGWLEGPEDVARAYSSTKCFINPSYNEGGPRVVLEAMACGLPVITTPVGLMHDIIHDGQNGLITDWDSTQMARKVLELLSDSGMQNRFSVAGLELVKQFEKKAAIENYAMKLQEIKNPNVGI